MYARIYVTYYVIGTNHSTRITVHMVTNITEQIWLLHSKYSSHVQHTRWAYRPNIFAYIYAKKHLSAAYTSHITSKIVPKTNLSTNLGTYAIQVGSS